MTQGYLMTGVIRKVRAKLQGMSTCVSLCARVSIHAFVKFVTKELMKS